MMGLVQLSFFLGLLCLHFTNDVVYALVLSDPAAAQSTMEITNFVSNCFADYAVLNNAWQAGTIADGNCQNFYAKIPIGWELVPPDDEYARLVIQSYSFGFQQITLADGSAYKTQSSPGNWRNAKPVSTGNLDSSTFGYKAMRCNPGTGVLIRRAHPTVRVETDFSFPMRSLIISSSLVKSELPQAIYQSYGAPYTLLNVQDYPNEVPLSLESPTGAPLYNAIILTDAQLIRNTNEGYKSAFTHKQWMDLRRYRGKYGVRLVVLASDNNQEISLRKSDKVNSPGGGSNDPATIKFMNNTLAKNIGDSVPLNVEIKLVAGSSFWYAVQLDTSVKHAPKPFLSINGSELIGAYVRECANNEKGESMLEEMHFLFSMSVFYSYPFALGDVWFTWVNKGLYLGQRRVMLVPQVDDLFLDTTLFNIHTDEAADHGRPDNGAQNGTSYRSNATDMLSLVEYQRNLNKRLPAGSKITIELAFNGKGYADDNVRIPPRKASMNSVVSRVRDEFNWLSHTWSHLDLYCPESDCAKNGETTYDAAYKDLELNCKFAQDILFAKTAADGTLVPMTRENMSRLPNYSCKSLVTPRISGLNHTASIKAILDLGMETVVGDNSRADLKPSNVYHMLKTESVTKKDKKIAWLHIIPRMATRVYFDCSLPEENRKEHNSIYGPNCIGHDKDGPIAVNGKQKCNSSSFKYDHDLSWEEILEIEAKEVAENLLKKRHDPYMFHQANLRFFWENGQKRCLLCQWLDHVVTQYQSYSNLPLFSVKMDQLRQYYEERITRDECGIVGNIVYKNGSPVQLSVTSSRICNVKITRSTGTEVVLTQKGNKRRDLNTEKYGPDQTLTVSSPGNEAVILDASICKFPCNPDVGPEATTTLTAVTTAVSTTTISPTVPGDASQTSSVSNSIRRPWIIAVIVVSSLIVIGLLISVFFLIRKKKIDAANKKLADRSGPVST